MRILQIHNSYRQAGGEDMIVRAEAQMLRDYGHEVLLFSAENGGSPFTILRAAYESDWSPSASRCIEHICKEFQPDVAHVHNFWMAISPSVHAACHSTGVPTVQTLHNYRIVCPNGQLLRDGRVCEACVGSSPIKGVIHRCYRRSASSSALVARMISKNQRKKTWWTDVDAFIALTQASADIFRKSGALPPEKLYVKPNFTADPGRSPRRPSESKQVVFVGRLSAEKGVDLLIEAWRRSSDVPDGRELLIAGDGPEAVDLHRKADGARHPIHFLGNRNRQELTNILNAARFCVVPSTWLEPFGLVVIEAYACGRPAVTFDIGGPGELVRCGVTGLKVPVNDVASLTDRVDRLCNDDDLVDRLGASAREEYLTRFTPAANIKALLTIYDSARDRFHGSRREAWQGAA